MNGWDAKIVSVEELPSDLVGDPPPAGYAYIQVTFAGTRTDSEPESIVLLSPNLLGATGVERGSITDPICFGTGDTSIDQVHQGGTVQSSTCISMPVGDVPNMVAKLGGFLDEKWFAVR